MKRGLKTLKKNHAIYASEPQSNFLNIQTRREDALLHPDEVDGIARKLKRKMLDGGPAAIKDDFDYYRLLFPDFRFTDGPISNFVTYKSRNINGVKDDSKFSEKWWRTIESNIKYFNGSGFNDLRYSSANVRQTVYDAQRDNREKSPNQGSYITLGSFDDENNYIPVHFSETNTSLTNNIERLAKKLTKPKQKYLLYFFIKVFLQEKATIEEEAFKANPKNQPRLRQRKFPLKTVAELMCDKFGGSFEANLKYVKRFRKFVAAHLTVKPNTTYGSADYKVKFLDAEIASKNAEKNAKYKAFTDENQPIISYNIYDNKELLEKYGRKTEVLYK